MTLTLPNCHMYTRSGDRRVVLTTLQGVLSLASCQMWLAPVGPQLSRLQVRNSLTFQLSLNCKQFQWLEAKYDYPTGTGARYCHHVRGPDPDCQTQGAVINDLATTRTLQGCFYKSRRRSNESTELIIKNWDPSSKWSTIKRAPENSLRGRSSLTPKKLAIIQLSALIPAPPGLRKPFLNMWAAGIPASLRAQLQCHFLQHPRTGRITGGSKTTSPFQWPWRPRKHKPSLEWWCMRWLCPASVRSLKTCMSRCPFSS